MTGSHHSNASDRPDRIAVIREALAYLDSARYWHRRAEQAEAERDRLRAALEAISAHGVRRTYAGDAVQDALRMQSIARAALAPTQEEPRPRRPLDHRDIPQDGHTSNTVFAPTQEEPR